MKLQFKEDWKEWRKVTLISLIGPLALCGILFAKGVIDWIAVAWVFGAESVIALFALLRPRWFRGYYRFGTWLGFHTAMLFGKAVLTAIFFFIVTPLGWGLRVAGKDLLRLKPRHQNESYWLPANQDGSLDHMY